MDAKTEPVNRASFGQSVKELEQTVDLIEKNPICLDKIKENRRRAAISRDLTMKNQFQNWEIEYKTFNPNSDSDSMFVYPHFPSLPPSNMYTSNNSLPQFSPVPPFTQIPVYTPSNPPSYPNPEISHSLLLCPSPHSLQHFPIAMPITGVRETLPSENPCQIVNGIAESLPSTPVILSPHAMTTEQEASGVHETFRSGSVNPDLQEVRTEKNKVRHSTKGRKVFRSKDSSKKQIPKAPSPPFSLVLWLGDVPLSQATNCKQIRGRPGKPQNPSNNGYLKKGVDNRHFKKGVEKGHFKMQKDRLKSNAKGLESKKKLTFHSRRRPSSNSRASSSANFDVIETPDDSNFDIYDFRNELSLDEGSFNLKMEKKNLPKRAQKSDTNMNKSADKRGRRGLRCGDETSRLEFDRILAKRGAGQKAEYLLRYKDHATKSNKWETWKNLLDSRLYGDQGSKLVMEWESSHTENKRTKQTNRKEKSPNQIGKTRKKRKPSSFWYYQLDTPREKSYYGLMDDILRSSRIPKKRRPKVSYSELPGQTETLVDKTVSQINVETLDEPTSEACTENRAESNSLPPLNTPFAEQHNIPTTSIEVVQKDFENDDLERTPESLLSPNEAPRTNENESLLSLTKNTETLLSHDNESHSISLTENCTLYTENENESPSLQSLERDKESPIPLMEIGGEGDIKEIVSDLHESTCSTDPIPPTFQKDVQVVQTEVSVSPSNPPQEKGAPERILSSIKEDLENLQDETLWQSLGTKKLENTQNDEKNLISEVHENKVLKSEGEQSDTSSQMVDVQIEVHLKSSHSKSNIKLAIAEINETELSKMFIIEDVELPKDQGREDLPKLELGSPLASLKDEVDGIGASKLSSLKQDTDKEILHVVNPKDIEVSVASQNDIKAENSPAPILKKRKKETPLKHIAPQNNCGSIEPPIKKLAIRTTINNDSDTETDNGSSSDELEELRESTKSLSKSDEKDYGSGVPERIYDQRTKFKQLQYYVKWVGYPLPTWEPAITFDDAAFESLLEDWKARKKQRRKSRRRKSSIPKLLKNL